MGGDGVQWEELVMTAPLPVMPMNPVWAQLTRGSGTFHSPLLSNAGLVCTCLTSPDPTLLLPGAAATGQGAWGTDQPGHTFP